MFLEFFRRLLCIIQYILLVFIEDHSVLVGVVSSVIVGSLWLKKFIRQKRAEAFFGFYAKLSLRLGELRRRLEEKDQLNIDDAEAGNIFSLLYLTENIVEFCPGYNEPDQAMLGLYQMYAKELEKLLLETKNNVYPKNTDRKRWYKSQQTIFSFCEFLINDACRNMTNIKFETGIIEPKHIVKCKELVQAMDYIQESISNAKY